MFSDLPFPVKYSSPAGRPWVILIHGLGMSEKSWTDPFGENLLEGMVPFDWVLTDIHHPPALLVQIPWVKGYCPSTPLRLLPQPPLAFWELLVKNGFGALAWSQQNPSGSIASALEELEDLVRRLPPEDPFILLGHSRGGLIARRFIHENSSLWPRIRGVLLLGSPNHGNRMAGLAKLLGNRWLWGSVERMISRKIKAASASMPDHDALASVLDQLRSFLQKPVVLELAPDSSLMQGLRGEEGRERESTIPYFNFIGTCPTFIRFHRLLQADPLQVEPQPSFSILDEVEGLVPRIFLPAEVQQGKGDGQVNVESAHLAWARQNHLFPINHAQLLVDGEVQAQALQILQEI